MINQLSGVLLSHTRGAVQSFWTLGTAETPENCVEPPMATRDASRMVAFAPFQGFTSG
jgi:hypothetical protein